MFRTSCIVTCILLIPITFLLNRYFTQIKVEIEQDGYFGSGVKKPDDDTIYEYKVIVDNQILVDLKYRLENSRITHLPLEDSDDFYYGFNSNELQYIRDYWLNEYDWRKYEQLINEFDHFKTQIEGLNIHYIHSKPSKQYNYTLPLLLIHGWPTSVFEFYKFIPILTDPRQFGFDTEYAFEVIVPSIPGFGWSDEPKKTKFSPLACARVFQKLMNRLGFNKFYIQGGDWGYIINTLIAKVYPEKVMGLHSNLMLIPPFSSIRGTLIDIIGTFVPSILSSPELQKSHNFFTKIGWLGAETGFMHIQGTKPDTIGAGLNDSPIGLAAYMLEKFSTWTNKDYRGLNNGGLNNTFNYDELITHVMIYWLNSNVVSTLRFDRDFFIDADILKLSRQYVSVPTGHASGLREMIDRTPIEVSKYSYNITHYSEIDVGHFAALENPHLLAKSLFSFVSDLIE